MATTTKETTSSPTINNVNWFEIAVSDLERAATLYEATLDTKLQRRDFMGSPQAYFPRGDGAIGALIVDPARPVRAGHSTVIYLRTADIAAAVNRGREAGAAIVQPVTSIGPLGSVALLSDHDGNVFGLHQEAE